MKKTWKSNSVKQVCVSLSPQELKVIRDFIENGFAPSVSETVRFCILYSLEKLQKVMKNQEVIIKRTRLTKAQRKEPQLPKIIFVKNGKVYDKYQRINKNYGKKES